MARSMGRLIPPHFRFTYAPVRIELGGEARLEPFGTVLEHRSGLWEGIFP